MNCKHGIPISENFLDEPCFHCRTEARFRWRRMIANLRRKRKAIVVDETSLFIIKKKEDPCDTKSG